MQCHHAVGTGQSTQETPCTVRPYSPHQQLAYQRTVSALAGFRLLLAWAVLSGCVMLPQLDQALAWAWAIAGTDQLTLQTFDDRKGGGAPQVRGGSLGELWPWVQAQQAAGQGVFATVNETPLGHRKAADVTAVRALFADFDGGGAPDAWHLLPTLIVQSRRGLHAYWAIDGMAAPDAAAFRSAQHRIAQHYGSDRAVCDLPRVMRLPGTYQCKIDPPYLVTILQDTGAAYTVAEILHGLAELPRPAPVRVDLAIKGGRLDLTTLDVAAWARSLGLEPRRHGSTASGDARWAIRCPWQAQHTDGAQGTTATVLIESRGKPPGFRCLHAHCADRRLADVLAHYGIGAAAGYAETRPSMRAMIATSRADAIDRGMPWNR